MVVIVIKVIISFKASNFDFHLRNLVRFHCIKETIIGPRNLIINFGFIKAIIS